MCVCIFEFESVYVCTCMYVSLQLYVCVFSSVCACI